MTRERWFLRPYIGFIDTWLRYGKPLSTRVGALVRAQEPVDLTQPFVFSVIRRLNPATLEDLAAWLALHTQWVSDPLNGLVDYFPTAGNIEYQLNHGDGIFRDDCDGLAYLTALAVGPFCDDPSRNWLVTVIYDPAEVPMVQSAHVMHLFHRQGWRLFSNGELEAETWPTPCAALYDNRYHRASCQGARLKHVEVRTKDLGLVASGLAQCAALFGCEL